MHYTLTMVTFLAVIKKFGAMGDKTGWTYIDVPEELALQLKPNNKKAFRVKGKLDDFVITQVSLVPMGGGNFILAINEDMRRGLKKRKGETISVKIVEDKAAYQPAAYITDCINDEPAAAEYFALMPQSHKNYFTKWVESAKLEETRTRRLAQMIDALLKKWDYGQMIRAGKKDIL